jgi:branched-chain amino acid transport system substrate-binding protein
MAVLATAAWGSSQRSSKTASPANAATALVKCGKTRTFGLMAPFTGPAASVGQQQVRWVKYFVKQYNKRHKTRDATQNEDTMLGGPNGTAEALKGAQALASSSKVLATVGPAGSNEIVGVTKTLKDAGLAWVSGSSTRTSLTLDGTRTGFMFRTVPPDRVQGTTAADFIVKNLKLKRVFIIDDEEIYSTGLADTVQSRLRAAGVSVRRTGISQSQSDFSSVIATIPGNTQLIYIPWQLTGQAIPFVRQLKQAGKGRMKVMGADGLFDPSFAALGSNIYDTSFPLNPKSTILQTYAKAHHGNGDYFGAPSFAAAQVVSGAIDRACKNGTASRAEVRAQIKRTRIPANSSVLGVVVGFDRHGDLRLPKKFGIYKSVNGKFVPIA